MRAPRSVDEAAAVIVGAGFDVRVQQAGERSTLEVLMR